MFNKDEFENSEMYYKRAISIPIFSSMSLDQQDKIVNTIKEVFL
jgi:dTDP-4-amino-4,6-dideoxygalactose transaminase